VFTARYGLDLYIKFKSILVFNPPSGVKVRKLAGYNKIDNVRTTLHRSTFAYLPLPRMNNIKLFTVAMEMQQWFPFALLPRYKIFRTAVNKDKY